MLFEIATTHIAGQGIFDWLIGEGFGVAVFLVVVTAANLLIRLLILRGVRSIIASTRIDWAEALDAHRVFHRTAYFFTALIIS
jgi:hypothetical protein